MRHSGKNRARSARTAFAAWGALLAVAVALIAQTLAFGAHTARAGANPRAAAVALSRVLGSPVVLCVQDDGAPPDSAACHNACPLCQLADHSLAPLAPNAPAASAPLPIDVDQPLSLAVARPEAEPLGLPFATGPPLSS